MQATPRSRTAGCTALAGALLASLGWAATGSSPAIGTAAPDFAAHSYVTGKTTRLLAQRGKVVILTFWATWCAPCRMELPNLEELQEKVGKDRLVVLAVNYRDSDETMAYLKKDAKQASWKITMLEDPHGSIATAYGIQTIPRLFLIGRDGKIVATHAGFGDGSLDQMLPEIDAALAGKPIPGT